MTKKITVTLTDDQNYLLNALVRSHLKDLRDFEFNEKEIAFAIRLLDTLAKAKVNVT